MAPATVALTGACRPDSTHYSSQFGTPRLPKWQTRRGPPCGRVSRPATCGDDGANAARRGERGPTGANVAKQGDGQVSQVSPPFPRLRAYAHARGQAGE